MKANRLTANSLIFLIVSLLFPPWLRCSLPLSLLPPEITRETPYHVIQTIQPSEEDGILLFEIHSMHALYQVEGFKMLVTRLHEIEVIERIKRHEQGSGFFDGASASVEATVDGVENLLTHPVESVKGLGQAAGKLGRNVGGVFRKKQSGEKSSLGEKMLGANERELAKEFNVDVYTTNPHLKGLLAKMARARLGGKGAVMVIKLLVPVAAVASMAMTAGGVNSAADQLVNDSNREDLYRLNKQAYLNLGWDEPTVQAVLNLPYFTSREQTYFRFYMERLKTTENAGSLVLQLINAKTEWQARRQLYEAELAAAVNEKKGATKVWDYPEGLAILDSENQLIYIAAYDYLNKGPLTDTILKQVQSLQQEIGAAKTEIRNGGKIDPAFSAQAQQSGIRTHEWSYFEKTGHESI